MEIKITGISIFSASPNFTKDNFKNYRTSIYGGMSVINIGYIKSNKNSVWGT